jgi:CelD/BcsL family acetyltransferase involved in cellulose biosynthesis
VRLSFGDEAIGFLYTLTSGGSVCFYQSGLKYHPDNRLKPGLVTHVLAAEYLLENGADEYDFLGGEPVPVRYKRSLSTDVRMLAWLHLPAPSLKMQAFYAVRRLVRALRSGGSGADVVKALREPDITQVDGNGEPPAPRGHDRGRPSSRAQSRLAS